MFTNEVYYPCEQLSPYIYRYWIGEVFKDASIPVQKFPSSGYPALLISFGPNKLDIRNYGKQVHPCFPVTLLGQFFNHIDAWLPEEMQTMGILFKPSALPKFFNIHMGVSTHQILDGEEVLDRGLHPIPEVLAGCHTNHQRIYYIEQYLIHRLQSKKQGLVSVDGMLDYIMFRQGKVTVRDISSYFNYSERYIEKIFQDKIGLPPKYFCRVMQFNYALSLVLADPRIKFADLAYEAGYVGQSHFIRSFTEFTGKSPLQYVKEDHELTDFHIK